MSGECDSKRLCDIRALCCAGRATWGIDSIGWPRDRSRYCGGVKSVTTVLHLSSSSGPGGAETVVASVASGLDSSRYRSIVCLFRDGWLRDRCEQLGLETHVVPINGILDLGWLRQF